MGRQKRFLSAIMLICCVTAVLIMICSIIFGKRETRAVFTPPDFDASAVAGTPDGSLIDYYGSLSGGDYQVSLSCKLKRMEEGAEIWLTNPVENTVWLKARITDEQGNILGETGLIRPGEYVQSVQWIIDPPAAPTVSIKIMAYEPDSYYSAGAMVLNTEIY